MTQYRQSGVTYRESGVAYATPITITPATIAATATIPTNFQFEYRQSGQAYRNSHDYRQALISGNVYLVEVTPAAVAVTTSITATVGISVTVSPGVIACQAVIIPNVTANTIAIHGGTVAQASVPSVLISATVIPATVAAEATVPDESLYITVDAEQDEPIEAAATIPSATASGNYTATPATIGVGATTPTVSMFRYLIIPTTNIVPSVGLRNEPTPAAYSLMRHYESGLRGDNIFIINGTTVQDYLPVDKTTVTRWIYGGHESPKDLTNSEQTVLLAAGYSFRVGPG